MSAPAWGDAPSRRRSRGASAALWIALAAFLAVLVIVMRLVGPANALAAGAVALAPLAVVVGALQWVDRWEPEPRGALAFAALWGAGAAVLIALVGNQFVANEVLLLAAGANPDWVESAIAAPAVEEAAKGLAVVILFFARRRDFDSPVDGVVYAGYAAAGFAFSENLLYFGGALATGGPGVEGSAEFLSMVFGRAVMSPFAHVLFTSVIGLAIGWIGRRRSAALVLPLGVAGWLGAACLHGLWNAGTLSGQWFWPLYLLVQVPIFVGAILLVRMLRREEQATIARGLSPYVAAGWIAPEEAIGLASLRIRRSARSWAAGRGADTLAAMKEFQREATKLAYLRGAALAGNRLAEARLEEANLLDSLARARARWQTAPASRIV